MKKAQIVNLNYVGRGRRLQRASIQHEKPWIVICPDIANFATHAEAIQYADKLARGNK